MDSDDAGAKGQLLPPLKDLASSDPKLRASALQTLLTHLSSIPSLTHLQTLQIWRTLFYLLYMHSPRATSPLATQTLISTLTMTLLHTTIPASNSRLKLALTRGFWETMATEWGAIDRHRMDKYMLLVRMMVRATVGLVFEAISTAEGDGDEDGEGEGEGGIVAGHLEVLAAWPMSSGRGNGPGRRMPDGIRYHVLDVWVDEIEKGMEVGDQEESQETKKRREKVTVLMMGLVGGLAKDALTKGVRIKAKEVLADQRLLELRPTS